MGCAGSASVKAGNPSDTKKVTPAANSAAAVSGTTITGTNSGQVLARGTTQSYFIRENEKEVKENYVIKNKIGEGVFGVVRLIVDKNTGEEKALKLISKRGSEKDQESTLLNEIKIMKTLDHPSIVKMYEYYQDKKNFYIVTELLKGGELFDKIIELTSFAEKDAAEVFRQLISVVQYAHENRIMHRDLKPENILLEHSKDKKDNPYAIKVVDWGSAINFTEAKEKKVVGTSFYMAPEVVNKSYTNKCDLWSCGVILYIMITGEPPFYGNDNEIFQSVIECKYDMHQDVWANISSECKDLIGKLLCPEDKRLTAKQVQEHPWLKNTQKTENAAQKEESMKSLQKLKKFTTKNQFHHAILTFISSQLTLKEDQSKFKQIFETLDSNNDGSLTKDEIKQGFSKYAEMFNGDYDAETIFKNIDVDGNGKINYSEFITASLQFEGAVIDEHLQKTFKAFDTDGNNFLTQDELKDIFGVSSSSDDKEILKMVQTIDQNNDGKISFEEFKAMMKKYSEEQH